MEPNGTSDTNNTVRDVGRIPAPYRPPADDPLARPPWTTIAQARGITNDRPRWRLDAAEAAAAEAASVAAVIARGEPDDAWEAWMTEPEAEHFARNLLETVVDKSPVLVEVLRVPMTEPWLNPLTGKLDCLYSIKVWHPLGGKNPGNILVEYGPFAVSDEKPDHGDGTGSASASGIARRPR